MTNNGTNPATHTAGKYPSAGRSNPFATKNSPRSRRAPQSGVDDTGQGGRPLLLDR
jgi:hypothetical protein